MVELGRHDTRGLPPEGLNPGLVAPRSADSRWSVLVFDKRCGAFSVVVAPVVEEAKEKEEGDVDEEETLGE